MFQKQSHVCPQCFCAPRFWHATVSMQAITQPLPLSCGSCARNNKQTIPDCNIVWGTNTFSISNISARIFHRTLPRIHREFWDRRSHIPEMVATDMRNVPPPKHYWQFPAKIAEAQTSSNSFPEARYWKAFCQWAVSFVPSCAPEWAGYKKTHFIMHFAPRIRKQQLLWYCYASGSQPVNKTNMNLVMAQCFVLFITFELKWNKQVLWTCSATDDAYGWPDLTNWGGRLLRHSLFNNRIVPHTALPNIKFHHISLYTQASLSPAALANCASRVRAHFRGALGFWRTLSSACVAWGRVCWSILSNLLMRSSHATQASQQAANPHPLGRRIVRVLVIDDGSNAVGAVAVAVIKCN